MIGQPQPASEKLSEEAAAELFRSLLHKEGCWVDWGIGCQTLQKSGYGAMEVFEKTGFQGSQQNMIVVAAQVYQSIENNGGSPELLEYCRGPRSDVLYELRILNNQQRAIAAQVAKDKGLEFDDAKELAKAMQHFVRLPQIPDGFTEHPGDAMAYQAWRAAKQKKDLPSRTRLIAKGLRFAYSDSARKKVEQLLSDLSAPPKKSAPLLPINRYEDDNAVPALIAVAGTLPLTAAAIAQTAQIQQQDPFNVVEVQTNTTVVPLPCWQSVLTAVDPVVIFSQTDQLPQPIPGKPEAVLILLDRAKQDWNDNSYFAIANAAGEVELGWFETKPDAEIIGQILLMMRPKKIFDENNLYEPWQMDD